MAAKAKPARPSDLAAVKLTKDTGAKMPPAEFKFRESHEDPREILQRCVTYNDNHTGINLHENTTLEELTPIIGFFDALREHCGFFIGDAMVFGRSKFGERMEWAMKATGRALSTVKNYEVVAKAFPSNRKSSLSFTHYQALAPVARLEDKAAVKALIKEAEGKNGEDVMSVRVLRALVSTLHPQERRPSRNKKPAEKAKANARKKPPIEKPVYEMTPEESAASDALFEALASVDELITKPMTEGGKSWVACFLACNREAKFALIKALSACEELHRRLVFKSGYQG